MKYEGMIYRPPSEAYSLILQVSVGCSHNKCTFCGSFKDKKFRVKSFEEIKEDVEEARTYERYVKKVFIADGDSLVIPQKRLLPIMELIKESFPKLERIGIYGNTKSILKKTPEELKALKDLGLGIIYLGVESGDQVTLDRVCKGTTLDKTAEAAQKVKDAGITLSVTVLLGLGGVERSHIHAEETGKFLSRIQPEYVGALSIIVVPGTPLAQELEAGTFQIPTPYQLLEELAIMIKNMNMNHTFFASNHASNYLPVKVWLPEDKERALRAITHVLDRKDPSMLRPESSRAPLVDAFVDAPLRVRYVDTDRMGIVYYGKYPIYFEVGRTEFMRHKGLPYRELEEKGYSLVVTGLEIKYYNPAMYDDMLTVRTSVSDVQSRGATFNYVVSRDGSTIVIGKTRHVCLAGDRKPTRLPSFLVEVLKNAPPT